MNASHLNPLILLDGLKNQILGLVIDSYLGKYLKDVRRKIKIRMFAGEIELHGAELVQHALDEIKLPVGIRHGILGHLIIKNLWHNSATRIILSDLVLIVQPLSSFEVSEEHDKLEDTALWEAKETKIKRHVKRWINQMFRRYTGAAPVEQISMIEKQFNDLIRLVEIDINRVHIMLEDEHSSEKNPYTLGVVIDSIKLETKPTQYMDRTASHDVRATEDHSVTDVQTKSIKIENMRVYLNSGHIGELPIRTDLPKWRKAQDVWKKNRKATHLRRSDGINDRSLHRNSRNSIVVHGGGGGGGSKNQLRTNSIDMSSMRNMNDTNQQGNNNKNTNHPHHHQNTMKTGNELGDIYTDFGPVIAAQFRLMRTSPHHENDEHADAFIVYPDGKIGTLLKNLPKLKRLLPGGWKSSHNPPLPNCSYFSSWSLLNDSKLDHIIHSKNKKTDELSGVSGQVIYCENKGNIERYDEPPRRSVTIHIPDVIHINFLYDQVRHIESFLTYLKGYDSFELARRLGHENNSPRPSFTISAAWDLKQGFGDGMMTGMMNGDLGQTMSELKYKEIVRSWWKYAITVVIAKRASKKAKQNWAYIFTYIKRRRTYIDNFKKLQYDQKIWVADRNKLKQISPPNDIATGKYLDIISLEDPRLQLVKHNEVDVKWGTKGTEEEKNKNITIEKDKKLGVEDIMLFRKLGYAELQLEYYKKEYDKAMKQKNNGIDGGDLELYELGGHGKKEEESWLLKLISGSSGGNSGSGNGGNSGNGNDNDNKKSNSKKERKEKQDGTLSKQEKQHLYQTVKYDKRTNRYGILPKKYVLEQYSIILGQGM